MKRIFCLLLAACMTLSLCACGKGSEKGAGNDTPSSDVEVSAPTESIPAPNEQETPGESEPSQPYAGKVDVDLTVLSSTMVYAEVLNMMTEPNAYDGKTVKMRGRFGASYGYRPDGTINEDVLIFACIIADATACCSQGIEFVLSGAYNFPEDYPELDSEITVTGTFKSGEQNGIPYFRVINAQMTV